MNRDNYDLKKRFVGLRERVLDYCLKQDGERLRLEMEYTSLCPSVWQTDIRSPINKTQENK